MTASPSPQMLCAALRGLWFLPPVGAVAALILVPWQATPDSAGYLRNANVLLQGEATEAYLLIREPGLPLLIRALWATVGRSELWFVATNGALAGIAVALAAATFPELGSPKRRVGAALVTLLAPVYFVYAGMVLQQVGMAALLSAVGLILRWIALARPIRPLPFLLLAFVLAAASYWAALFMYVGIAIGAALAIWLWCSLERSDWRGKRGRLVLCVLAVPLVPWLAMRPWSAWKTRVADQRAHISESRTDRAFVRWGASLEDDFLSAIAADLRDDSAGLLRSRARAVLALLQLEEPLRQLGISQSRSPGFAATEDLLWTARLATPDAHCGIVDLVPRDRGAIRPLVELHCRHWSPMQTYQRLARPTYFYGTIASFGLLGFTAWSAARRRDHLLVLAAPWAWIGMYTLAGGAIDRYANPIWPLKTYLLTMLILAAMPRVVRPSSQEASLAATLGSFARIDP